MWHRLDFKLGPQAEDHLFKGRLRSEIAFRKLLAALDTKYGIGLPPQFFGYGAEGRPDPKAEITIGMGCTPGGLCIVATGSAASQLLRDRAGAVNAALMHEAHALIPMVNRGGEHEANFLPFERRFFISNLAVGKQGSSSFWARAASAVKSGSTWMNEADRKIPYAISRGLFRQCVFLCREGDDLEGNVGPVLSKSLVDGAPWLDTGAEFGRLLDVKLHAVGGHTFAKLDENRTRLVLRNVEFTMRGDFTGPWFVGRLKIEGQGLLVPSSRAWIAEQKAA